MLMTKRSGLGLVAMLVVVAGLLLGGSRTYAERPAAAAAPQAVQTKGMFWKVTSPTTTLYLLGSLHLASPDLYPLAPEIEKAFKDSAALAVEADITKVNQTTVMAFVMKEGMYAGNDSLDKHVPAETVKAAVTFCKANGLPEAAIMKMKPWMLAVTISELMVVKEGLDPKLGLDMHFLVAAKEKTIVELESVEGQLKMLAGIDEKLQAKFLAASLDDAKEMKETLKKLVTAWKTGDEKAVEDLTAKDYRNDADAKALLDLLIYTRNKPMAAKVAELAKGDKPAFVVVGTAHLVGEKGVANLLAGEGFNVEQVTLSPAPKTAGGATTKKAAALNN